MILSLKAADSHTEIALYRPGSTELIGELGWESGRLLADQLLAKLTDFLAAQSTEFSQLSGIIIFSGPGSFTSLRIGHSVANALADSLGIPIAGAAGEHWVSDAANALADTPVAQPALPHYGAEANITRPGQPPVVKPET